MKPQVTKYLKVVLENWNTPLAQDKEGSVFDVIGEDAEGYFYYKGADGLIHKTKDVDVFSVAGSLGHINEKADETNVFLNEDGELTGTLYNPDGPDEIPQDMHYCALVVSSEFISVEDIKALALDITRKDL